MSRTITLLIAGGSRITRAALRSVLKEGSDLRVVGDAADSQSVIRLVTRLKPRIAILYSALPKGGVLSTARRIVSGSRGQVGVVVLSAYPIRMLFTDVQKAGCAGYLDETSSLRNLLTCIHTVAEGHTYFTENGKPSMSRGTGSHELNGAREPSLPSRSELSSRELQVLELLAEGKHVDHIAKSLFISRKTVESHRSHVMDKLQLHTIAELTKYAIQTGLTALDD